MVLEDLRQIRNQIASEVLLLVIILLPQIRLIDPEDLLKEGKLLITGLENVKLEEEKNQRKELLEEKLQ